MEVSLASQAKEPEVMACATKASIWPEPDWNARLAAGAPKHELALLFSVYHSIATTPPAPDVLSIYGINTSSYEIALAYTKALTFIKTSLDTGVDDAKFQSVKSRFDDAFCSAPGRPKLEFLSVATWKGATYYHPLSGGHGLRQLRHLLPLLDWPNTVSPLDIPCFPIQCTQPGNTGTFRLCKPVSHGLYQPITISNTTNQYASYQEAVDALVAHFQHEFMSGHHNTDKPTACCSTEKPGFPGITQIPPSVPLSTFSMFRFASVCLPAHHPHLSLLHHSLCTLAKCLSIPTSWLGGGLITLRAEAKPSVRVEKGRVILSLNHSLSPGDVAYLWFLALDRRLNLRWLNQGCSLAQTLSTTIPACVDKSHEKRFMAYWELYVCCNEAQHDGNSAKSSNCKRAGGPCPESNEQRLARAFEMYVQHWTRPFSTAKIGR